ncbi:MAG: flagellar motor stator protein MotA [Rhodospirillales bacterium]|nr:flagellar motor stator protein MotA [Rhodospirillales bacterium]MBO6786657.1 flagellar motor stator protein MotA [Rhodospirillales bacterium]
MFFIIGIVVVIGSVFGGYSVHGDLRILWQPIEYVIILGGALGAFLAGNPKHVVTGAFKSVGTMVKGPKYKKDAYVELLSCLYSVFRLAKSKGDLALEQHVEKPAESSLFATFPKFQSDHHAIEFLCDYLRLLTLGASNSHEIEAIMDEELEVHHHEKMMVANAMRTIGEAIPALGIVAAVLGVIVTMSSITEPPEVLGGLIGAALVGTFSGIFVAYGFVLPMGQNLEAAYNSEHHYYTCMKAGLMGHMQGYAPQVSVEFARKVLPDDYRPSFAELEELIQTLPTPS